MFLARVVGNVVATVKDPALVGKKILVVQPLDKRWQPQHSYIVAVDSVGAGAGETVYCCRGREASFPWYPDEVPTETAIVAIVVAVVPLTAGTRLPVGEMSMLAKGACADSHPRRARIGVGTGAKVASGHSFG